MTEDDLETNAIAAKVVFDNEAERALGAITLRGFLKNLDDGAVELYTDASFRTYIRLKATDILHQQDAVNGDSSQPAMDLIWVKRETPLSVTKNGQAWEFAEHADMALVDDPAARRPGGVTWP